jgi:hypothetical protein
MAIGKESHPLVNGWGVDFLGLLNAFLPVEGDSKQGQTQLEANMVFAFWWNYPPQTK